MSKKKRGYKCAVPNCENQKINKNVSYFSFPKGQPKYDQWIKSINNEHLKALPPNNVRYRFKVCERHFVLKQFQNSLRSKLNRNAYPSINLPNVDPVEDPMKVQPSTSQEIDYSDSIITENECISSTYDDLSPLESWSEPNATIHQKPVELHNSPHVLEILTAANFSKPRIRKRSISVVKRKIEGYKQKIRILRQRNRRLVRRITTLEAMNAHLRNKQQ